MNVVQIAQHDATAAKLIQATAQLAEAAIKPLTADTTQQIARLGEEVLTLAKRAT